VALPVGLIIGIFLQRFTQLFLGEVVALAITWFIVGVFTGITAYKLFRS
jgi:FtsH-binding integral membrane protein